MSLTLMYITNNPVVAAIAQKNGVDRIWIDLETLGKEERQKNMDCVKSHHTVNDVEVVSKILDTAKMLVRVNPWNETSTTEIDAVIKAGAEMIMLPMWKSVAEVSAFIKAVRGRVKTILLLETKEAVQCLDDVLKLSGIDEIHIGLNDLHLSYGLTFMFELLTNGVVETLCSKIKAAHIPYGFGGIAMLGAGLLPAENIIMEHYRLGSTRAILSRSFCNADQIQDEKEIENIFVANMKTLREFEKSLIAVTQKEYQENRIAVKKKVKEIVEKINEKRNG